jgi:hypothetical protein
VGFCEHGNEHLIQKMGEIS